MSILPKVLIKKILLTSLDEYPDISDIQTVRSYCRWLYNDYDLKQLLIQRSYMELAATIIHHSRMDLMQKFNIRIYDHHVLFSQYRFALVSFDDNDIWFNVWKGIGQNGPHMYLTYDIDNNTIHMKFKNNDKYFFEVCGITFGKMHQCAYEYPIPDRDIVYINFLVK